MKEFKDKEDREAEALGYGPGKPPYFLTAFIVFITRDKKTGGAGGVDFQCSNLDASLEKAKERMGIERPASSNEVLMACQEIVRTFNRADLVDEMKFNCGSRPSAPKEIKYDVFVDRFAWKKRNQPRGVYVLVRHVE